ncbi:MAG: ATP-binding protein [Actinomycetes bacterium]
MRRRLLQTTLTVAVVAVLLLGVPLAIAGALLQRETAQANVATTAATLGRALDRRVQEGLPVTPRLLDDVLGRDRLRAEVVLPDGTRVVAGPAVSGTLLTASVQTSHGVDVLVEESRALVDSAMRRIVLLVAAVAVVAVAAAVAVGVLQARRLARPLDELAVTAQRLGSGESRVDVSETGIEELDRLGEALRRSATRVADLLAAERRFASDASHQLRTPLAALSLRLDEIAETDDLDVAREEAAVALTQVERLTGVVQQLLDAARRTRAGTVTPVDVTAVVEQQLHEWRPVVEAAGRRLRVVGERPAQALATPGGLAQIVATLLENALMHGAGTITVTTRSTSTWTVVEVSDEGPGVPSGLEARIFERSVSGSGSTGLGLSLARDLAVVDGGRLELVRARPATFAVFLPAPVDPDAPPPPPTVA